MIGRTLGILIMLTALLAASQSVSSENITSENNKSGNVILGPPTIFNDTMNIKIAGNEKILNCSGTIPKASPAPMSDSDILATHNAYRIAVGEDPLVWSTELASYAQDWANYLVANNLFEHSYGLYGENLAAGPLTDSQLVDLWGAEKQYFKCGTFPDVSTTGNWRDVGHYTQMIWPDTEECGCGIASSSTYPYSKVLVCEYNPPGNFIGQYICPSNAYPNKPSIPSGPASGVAGTAYSYSTSATDPDVNQVKYTFDWGDGTTSVTSLVNSGTSSNASHTWSAAGTYLVKAMATDSLGATSGWSNTLSATITAPNRAPNSPSIPSGPASGVAGNAYSYSTSATDPDGNQVKYTFDWGDGTTSETSLVNSGTAASASHTWGAAGTYLVKAMATDSIGAASAWSNQLAINISQRKDDEWEKDIGGSGDQYGHSVQQTTDGGYIVTGNSIINYVQRVYLAKTDASGNVSWEKIHGSASCTGRAVRQTQDQGYIVAGTIATPGSNGIQIYLLKTDANGDKQWENNFGGIEHDEGNAVQQTIDGGYIVVGEKGNGGDFSQVYLVKTDALGNKEWEKFFGTTGKNAGVSVQQTADNGFIIAGYTESFGNATQVFLIRTDDLGNKIWENNIGGERTDVGLSVDQADDSGYVITGYTSLPGSDTQVYLVKTDPFGNKVWEINFGGANFEEGRSVKHTSDEGYIVAGTCNNGFGYLVYLVKTDSSGNKVWEKTFGPYEGRDVQQTSDSGYVVVGSTSTSENGSQVYLIKLKSNYPSNIPAIPSGQTSGILGASYTYSTSATDPDGDQISYTFDWGDGTKSTTGILDSGSIANASHIWNHAGIYEVKAKATDSKGLDSEWSNAINVSIADLPYISGTKFNDTNSNATRDPGEAGLPGWTIRLTRPDGTSINATTDAIGAYKFENLTSGTYRVSEIRQDNWTQTYPAWLGDHIINITDGSVTGVDFGNNYLPVPEIPFPPSGPASGIPGAEYSYTTSSTDPSGYQIAYTFDWGDGSNSTTGLFDSGAVASAGHIWNSSGVYEVRAMATNSKGASSGWSDPLNVTINAPPSIPTVTNGIGCSLVTAYSARLNGEIVDTGGENPTVHICWGTADGATTQASWQNDASLGVLGTGAFYKDISGLTPGTKYYYRCYATNSAGTGWAGSTANFTTQAVLIQPVYRMYSPSQTDHFYTTNYYEYSTIAPTYGYLKEGTLGNIYGSSQAGTIPIYRMYHPGQTDHFYTTNYNEYNTIAPTYGYLKEGTLGNIYGNFQTGTVPLYRMYNPSQTDHFYTTNYYEYDTIAPTYGYIKEGILGYIQPDGLAKGDGLPQMPANATAMELNNVSVEVT